jgi:hypothetical protein
MDETFSLTVAISADEWACAQRRIRYLEAALVQAYRNQRQLKEWFTAAELVALSLPDLPATRQALIRRAHAEHWSCRIASGRGGEHYEFHFVNLPRRAFEEMIRRIVEPDHPLVEEKGDVPEVPDGVVPASTADPVIEAPPVWLLPLMRIIKSCPSASVDDALFVLRRSLPPHATIPSRDEVADVISRHHRP